MRAFSRVSGDAQFRALAGGMSEETCEAVYHAGFTSYVPLGSLRDPHHSMCYRLFNLTREAQAHAYVTATSRAPMSPPWIDVQHTLP